MSKVQINIPGVAKDEDVSIAHLGTFPNGQTSTVTKEQADLWCAVEGREWPKSGTLKSGDVKFNPSDDAPLVGAEPVEEQPGTAEPPGEEA